MTLVEVASVLAQTRHIKTKQFPNFPTQRRSDLEICGHGHRDFRPKRVTHHSQSSTTSLTLNRGYSKPGVLSVLARYRNRLTRKMSWEWAWMRVFFFSAIGSGWPLSPSLQNKLLLDESKSVRAWHTQADLKGVKTRTSGCKHTVLRVRSRLRPR